MVSVPETILVRFAEAGGVHVSWRLASRLDEPHHVALDPEPVLRAVRELAAAAPTRLAGESIADAVVRATTGALADHEAELRLSVLLAHALLPLDLVEAIRAASAPGAGVPRIRIQPSPTLAGVPWAMLSLAADDEPDVRLVEIAEVSLLAPAAIVHDERRHRSAPGTAHVRVLDPRIPGQPASGALGSVLGRPDPTSAIARHFDAVLATEDMPASGDGASLQRRDIDRDDLSRMLHPTPASLLVCGHVSVADAGGTRQTVLHLSCSVRLAGIAAPIGQHRPLAAADLLDDAIHGSGRWPMPQRVALVACQSAGELGFAETFGVALAAVTAGAVEVTATTWTLPTDAAVAATGEAGTPFADLVVAADVALRAASMTASVREWQRRSLDAWRASPALARAPLWFASVSVLDTHPAI